MPRPRPRRLRAHLFPLLAFAWVCLGPARARAKGDDCEVTVAAGDTLSGIAARHGVSERKLVATNPALAKNPDLLRVGQKLDVCAARAEKKTEPRARAKRCGHGGRIVEHEVRSGETLSEIAGHYGVDEKAITDHNPALRKRPDLLRVGQDLEVCVAAAKVKNAKLCNYRTPVFHHEVVPGEHLGQIAGRYGVRRSDLVKWNASLRKNPDLLRVGQRITVCPEIAPRERTRITYTVRSGDNLGSIAARYGLTPHELERYQRGKLADANRLREGQSLVVWADGGVVPGFGPLDDDKGVLAGGMQLPPGRHYEVKWEAASWGTSHTIRDIQSAVASYQRKAPGGPKVHVGDISKRRGGPFRPHLSHQQGRDVDVGYVLKGKHAHETRFRAANASNLDLRRSWALVKSFIDTDDVVYVFMDYRVQKLLYEYAADHGVSEDLLDELFQYPRGRGRTHGLIRHWKGHINHFHVRFRR